MGWLNDLASGGVRAWGDAWKNITSIGGLAENDVSKFFENEVVNKADLRGAELVTGLSGLPIAGDLIRGINGVEQLEDLYNKTGKVPAYPGGSSNGASGVTEGLNDLAKGFSRKIENGTNSLHTFYSGEEEKPTWSTGNMFKDMSSGWNQTSYSQTQKYRKV